MILGIFAFCHKPLKYFVQMLAHSCAQYAHTISPAKVQRIFGTAKFLVEKICRCTLVVKNMQEWREKMGQNEVEIEKINRNIHKGA